MHYTLKDLAHLAGLNERTVINYLQRTGRLQAVAAKEGRRWRFGDEDLEAVRAVKQQLEEERTRSTPAAYTQHTDSAALAEVLARLEAVEEQLATLKRHASWLFAPVARSAPNLSEQSRARPRGAAPLGELAPASARTPGRAPGVSGAPGAPGAFPASANGRGRWVESMGGPGASWVRSWADVASWQGPEDAIAAVRRHKNWHDWQPAGGVAVSATVAGAVGDELEVGTNGDGSDDE